VKARTEKVSAIFRNPHNPADEKKFGEKAKKKMVEFGGNSAEK